MRWTSRSLIVGCFVGQVLLGLAAQPAVAQSKSDKSDAVQAEYDKQLAALKKDDVAGHFKLAEWCRDKGAFKLLRAQCMHVLSLDKNHAEAKLLLQLANRETGGSAGPQPPSSQPGGLAGSPAGSRPRLTTEAEIQRIRWKEFDPDNEPKALAVQFTNNVIDRFLAAMEGEEGFTTEDERRQFRTLSPNEKIRRIKEIEQKHPEQSDRFATDIVIKSDPRRMADFERRVLPLVIGGCATSNCHGGSRQSPFELYTDAVLNKEKVYSNYLMLHEHTVGDRRLIDRNAPDRSLLLTYGLLELSPNLDPSYKHPSEIKPFFRGVSDGRYKTIYDWIESLSAIAPDYGISLQPTAATP